MNQRNRFYNAQAKSESENSASSGSKRKSSRPDTENAYKKHIIRFRLNEKKKIKKRSINWILYKTLLGIQNKIDILHKQAEKTKTSSKRIVNDNVKNETNNLMTKVCTINVNIQNIAGRNSEDIVLSKLLRDVIDELMDKFIYRYPLLANVVRIPQFIQNVKSFQVPKYVVCILLLMGSNVLKDEKFLKVFTEKRRKRALNYVTEHMRTVISNPDCLSVWTMLMLSIYYITLGVPTQCTKYIHLSTRLAMSMRLHKIDEYCIRTPTNLSKDLIVESELKRRLWWCSYILSVLTSEATAVQPALQLKDILVNLPSNDRLWHTNSEFTISTTNSTKRGDMILSSQGEFKFDTFASYVILFKIRHTNITFINRRESIIAKDMGKDYRRYLRMFTNSMKFQESVVAKFHNELKKMLVFGVRNPDIVNVMNIEYFILRYCTLILNSCMANLYIGTSEISYYENVDIPPERVKLAKVILIEDTIRFTEIFYWLISNFSLEKFDVELNHMAFRVFKYLTNIECIKDLNRHNAIINGKKVISEYFERLESTSSLTKMYYYLLINFSNLKKSYDRANAKFRNIPPTFALKMLSPYDYNPWLVPTGSSHLKRVCCNNPSNPKIHYPFLLSRIASKRNLGRNKEFLSPLVNEASRKRFIMDIDLKSIIKELKNHHLPFEGLSGIDKQSFEKHNTHTISDFTLDGDPKDFYVNFVNFDERPQNTALLNQCKKLIERVFYPILDASTKYMDKNMSPIFDQNLTISSYKEAFSSFNFTELLYNPIEKAQSRDTTRGCELINKSNTHASFSSVVNSM